MDRRQEMSKVGWMHLKRPRHRSHHSLYVMCFLRHCQKKNFFFTDTVVYILIWAPKLREPKINQNGTYSIPIKNWKLIHLRKFY